MPLELSLTVPMIEKFTQHHLERPDSIWVVRGDGDFVRVGIITHPPAVSPAEWTKESKLFVGQEGDEVGKPILAGSVRKLERLEGEAAEWARLALQRGVREEVIAAGAEMVLRFLETQDGLAFPHVAKEMGHHGRNPMENMVGASLEDPDAVLKLWSSLFARPYER